MWRLRERISEKPAFQGAEVGLRMLQIQRVFSPQIRNREPFVTGWWRREWDSNSCYGLHRRNYAGEGLVIQTNLAQKLKVRIRLASRTKTVELSK
jgi:hypothetical protein